MFVSNRKNEAVINLDNVISIYIQKDGFQSQIMFVTASQKDIYWRFDNNDEASDVFRKLIKKVNVEEY